MKESKKDWINIQWLIYKFMITSPETHILQQGVPKQKSMSPIIKTMGPSTEVLFYIGIFVVWTWIKNLIVNKAFNF